MQVIYTLTLMALGVLPTPREESNNPGLVLVNSSGQAISVSFWPSLSVALSFLSIVVNCARTVNVIDWNIKHTFEGKENAIKSSAWIANGKNMHFTELTIHRKKQTRPFKESTTLNT